MVNTMRHLFFIISIIVSGVVGLICGWSTSYPFILIAPLSAIMTFLLLYCGVIKIIENITHTFSLKQSILAGIIFSAILPFILLAVVSFLAIFWWLWMDPSTMH
jgi:hypothetical protein